MDRKNPWTLIVFPSRQPHYSPYYFHTDPQINSCKKRLQDKPKHKALLNASSMLYHTTSQQPLSMLTAATWSMAKSTSIFISGSYSILETDPWSSDSLDPTTTSTKVFCFSSSTFWLPCLEVEAKTGALGRHWESRSSSQPTPVPKTLWNISLRSFPLQLSTKTRLNIPLEFDITSKKITAEFNLSPPKAYHQIPMLRRCL